ncbi:hypothetical protein QYE76_063661 [Lolium multiflorum]|uniref:Uncharacterized protein n=1 Tax=Lolium multiflorum TaxID=4521 RepID=A0AAD8W6T9_LOLMU|nr:hypothetical protein QYE76_063661 [Lolium multiflorum]
MHVESSQPHPYIRISKRRTVMTATTATTSGRTPVTTKKAAFQHEGQGGGRGRGSGGGADRGQQRADKVTVAGFCAPQTYEEYMDIPCLAHIDPATGKSSHTNRNCKWVNDLKTDPEEGYKRAWKHRPRGKGGKIKNKEKDENSSEAKEAKVGHRVEPWEGFFLAPAGRLELTNSCLSSLPLFAMGLYLLHDATHGTMNRHHSRFFWEGVGPKRKYHMVDWATVCKPKAFGGLGILNTKFMNIALMLKWIWKIYQNSEGLWADLLRAKYLAKHQVRNGKRTYFWLDWWTGTGPLRLTFPRLFACCDNHFATVEGVRDNNGWHIRFRRSFGLAETVEWENLCRIFDLTPISTGEYDVRWSLEASGEYSTNSMYCRLSQGGAIAHFKEV